MWNKKKVIDKKNYQSPWIEQFYLFCNTAKLSIFPDSCAVLSQWK